jgi:Carbohydrate esterase, sialic acid-specific acetylesterase
VKITPDMILPKLKEFYMKKQYSFIFMILMVFINHVTNGQYVLLSQPVYQGVYQRDNANNADIPISGQVFGFPTSTPGSYKIECITNRLNASGVVVPGTSSTTLITNNTVKGYFNGSINRPKGWYSAQIKFTFNATGYTSSTSSKFGVGDVFIIAGQSNGQGIPDGANPNLTFPNVASNPEWIVGFNENWDCNKNFETRPSSMTKISGGDRIAPKGNSSWCYGILGKKISDANGGMPVAFFNCAAGGSSVLNWKESANGQGTLHPYTYYVVNGQIVNKQYCNNSDPYIADPQYIGQPYVQLKNTLNWYAQLFGVRAILWHQGESDSDNGTSISSTKNAATYTSHLNEVISKSRNHAGVSNLSWMVANVSLTAGNTSGGTSPDANALAVLQGQQNATNGGTTRLGPLTDKYNGSSTLGNRYDNTHFSELYGGGLTVLSNLWNGFIDNSSSSITSFNRILPKPVPTVSISQSGSTFTFSVSTASSAKVCWTSGTRLSPPNDLTIDCLSQSNSFTSGSSTNLRCYIGTPNFLSGADYAVNWVSTAQVGAQNCPACREGVEEADETYGGINMKLYPNPSDKDFRVEFDVLEDDTHVKLEFFDMVGNSIKIVADGSHAKGHFTYPITESLPTGASICQLKVGEIFISKKVMRVN